MTTNSNTSDAQTIADLAATAWGSTSKVIVMISKDGSSVVVVEDGGDNSALFKREVTDNPVQAAIDYFQAEIILRAVGQGEDIMRYNDAAFWSL